MTTGKPNQNVDPYDQPLADHGKAAIMAPLIIGGAVLTAIIILWHSHNERLQLAETASIEALARQQLREAYLEMRALKPNIALLKAEEAAKSIDSLKVKYAPDYAQLKIALYLLEGESLFMKDCSRHADTAEQKFDAAIGLMPFASGDMWLFGMLGRARTRLEQKRYDGAIADLSGVLDRNPSFGAAYYWRAQAREATGDIEGARDDEKKARALDSWPPLRDFMQPSPIWTRDIIGKPKPVLQSHEQELDKEDVW